MKKTATLLILALSAVLLTSCGSYSKHQTPEQQAQPMSCAGLHMRGAQWHFTNDFGQTVDVVGTCKKGRKHGNFAFTVNGQVIAKTKFGKDVEKKTTCMVGGQKTRTPLEQCMQANAQNAVPQGSAVSDAEAVSDDNEADDAE